MSKGGRPAGEHRKLFALLEDEQTSNGAQLCQCVMCLQAYEKEPDTNAKPAKIEYRKERMLNHLRNCKCIPPCERAHVQGILADADKKSESSSATPAAPGSRVTPIDARDENTSGTRPLKQLRLSRFADRKLTATEKDTFNELLTECYVSNGWAFQGVESPSFRRLIKFLRPAVVDDIPGRKTLGGRLLKELASKSAAAQKKTVMKYSKMAPLGVVLDTYENTSRKHIMGINVHLFDGEWYYDAREAGEKHDGIAKAKKVEALFDEMEAKDMTVGSLCTDSDGGIARARRIMAPRWPRIIMSACQAHIMNCIVAAILRLAVFQRILTPAVQFVTKALHYTARWVPVLRTVVYETYQLNLQLLEPVPSRWNTMHACVASMLRIRSGLKFFVMRYKHEEDFPKEFLCTNGRLVLGERHSNGNTFAASDIRVSGKSETLTMRR
eukprot:GHVU01233709.1.p1 GENE.GHVU01233709.1~~GHVU01233709.1.p1  ORF type:complete len:440 (-),score=38.69 GHVU01233709.1:76-1395(-)